MQSALRKSGKALGEIKDRVGSATSCANVADGACIAAAVAAAFRWIDSDPRSMKKALLDKNKKKTKNNDKPYRDEEGEVEERCWVQKR